MEREGITVTDGSLIKILTQVTTQSQAAVALLEGPMTGEAAEGEAVAYMADAVAFLILVIAARLPGKVVSVARIR